MFCHPLTDNFYVFKKSVIWGRKLLGNQYSKCCFEIILQVNYLHIFAMRRYNHFFIYILQVCIKLIIILHKFPSCLENLSTPWDNWQLKENSKCNVLYLVTHRQFIYHFVYLYMTLFSCHLCVKGKGILMDTCSLSGLKKGVAHVFPVSTQTNELENVK